MILKMEIDLNKLIEENRDEYWTGNRTNEEIIEELNEIYDGNIEEGLIKDMKEDFFEEGFSKIFNC